MRQGHLESKEEIVDGQASEVNDTIYFTVLHAEPRGNNKLYALSTNGVKKWSFADGHDLSKPFARPDGTVLHRLAGQEAVCTQ